MKVLVIEDNRELASSILGLMAQEGYICELAEDYSNAWEKLHLFSYDCILLDIMLPDGNGLDLLTRIKDGKIQSGILIISAKNALDDKISGLELGADDYLTKPFHLSELHARLRAIYRRKQLGGSNSIAFNELVINTDSFEARVNGLLLDITRKEFELLLYLVVNKNRVLSRQAIAIHLWGDYIDGLPNFDFVYQHIKNLRKKINHLGGRDYIDTVYGLGYKFNADKYEAG
ncbi:response regulator transcription factor [Parapedobacter sp. ISTM3]|uniref:DNA-binding response regulator, OmpR family, contains REC and winged-helix (WHTH) domain n=1 Tax=Parapedobacter luteus TaxID=623280 RepID=A0A1T5D0Q6_9SPHI|nr:MULTISPECIES: response regulator transcription factor [Parapedobacter]MBK1440560.1 response regulator transcription factor [Parapedobacter sp. ISTM3]SKB65302.1 DNA-binding response regulator, OmpR family, contains REC and winged-helix (wHTH) domain [Parapedobacter luteus]